MSAYHVLDRKIILRSRKRHMSGKKSLSHFPLLVLVSYKEFLQLFRQQRRNMSRRLSELHLNETEKEPGDENLIGLDAKIPGGMYDDSVDPKYKSFSSGRSC